MAWMSRSGTLPSSVGSMLGLTTKACRPRASSARTRSQARSANSGLCSFVVMG